jgi:hypothetical protein
VFTASKIKIRRLLRITMGENNKCNKWQTTGGAAFKSGLEKYLLMVHE